MGGTRSRTVQKAFAAMLVVASVALANPGDGQENAKNSTGETSSTESGRGERPFTIEVVGAVKRAPAYGDNVVLTVKIHCAAPVEFKEFTLIPLGDLRALYRRETGDAAERKPDASNEPPSEATDLQGEATSLGSGDLGNSELSVGDGLSETGAEQESGLECEHDANVSGDAGTTLIVTCPLDAPGGRSLWRPNTWLLAPGPQQILFKVTATDLQSSDGGAEDGANGDNNLIYYEEIPITFRSPLGAIFLGGLTGALLLALFTAVRAGIGKPYLRVEVKETSELKEIARKFGIWILNLFPQTWKMLLETVMGGICAIILILLAQGTEGLNPPISIKIQDFWGGVVTGLFSIPLSQWIWAQVHTEPPAAGEKHDETDPKNGGSEVNEKKKKATN